MSFCPTVTKAIIFRTGGMKRQRLDAIAVNFQQVKRHGIFFTIKDIFTSHRNRIIEKFSKVHLKYATWSGTFYALFQRCNEIDWLR